MFSELVDEVCASTNRRDKLASIVDYARLTLRECQTLALFSRDLIETSFTATANPCTWTRPRGIRAIKAVRYGASRYVPMRRIGSALVDYTDYYYAAGEYYAFSGTLIGEVINVAYYRYAPEFQYIVEGSRPAVYNRALGTWQYRQPDGSYGDHIGAATPEEQELLEQAARDFVSHWLLQDWHGLIKSGTTTKLLAQTGETDRARSMYSIYKELQNDLVAGEGYESTTA